MVDFSDQAIADASAVKEQLVDLFVENPDSVAKYHAAWDDLAVIPNAKAKCGWGGLGEVPGKRSWYPLEHLGPSTLAHELGHTLGFGHQGRDICPPGVVTGCQKGDGHSKRTPMGAAPRPVTAHRNWSG